LHRLIPALEFYIPRFFIIDGTTYVTFKAGSNFAICMMTYRYLFILFHNRTKLLSAEAEGKCQLHELQKLLNDLDEPKITTSSVRVGV
jgi:hypothetical protein